MRPPQDKILTGVWEVLVDLYIAPIGDVDASMLGQKNLVGLQVLDVNTVEVLCEDNAAAVFSFFIADPQVRTGDVGVKIKSFKVAICI